MAFEFKKTDIADVFIIEPKIFGDERWFFMETYNKKDFFETWINCEFIQDNHSKSKKWVFRWFHFQINNPQAKLVRVIKWAVLDFAVDLRKDSSTYGKYEMIELTAENKRQFLIPRWFAHWFLTLEDDTEFVYKCDNFYDPNSEWWIKFNDLDLNINRDEIKSKYWISDLILSEKDKNSQNLKDFYETNPF